MSNSSANVFEELRALLRIVTQSLDNIEKFCATTGSHFPSNDEPFTLMSEAERLSPTIVQESFTLVGAASQLISIVRPSNANALVAILSVSPRDVFFCLV